MLERSRGARSLDDKNTSKKFCHSVFNLRPKIEVARRFDLKCKSTLTCKKLLYVFVSSRCSRRSTSRSCRQCRKKYVCPIKTTLDRSISFISDISIVSYNIRLTMIGQLATLYSPGLPTKKQQATVPTSLSTSHTLQIFIQSCFVLQKNRCMRKELKLSDLCLFNLLTKHWTNH